MMSLDSFFSLVKKGLTCLAGLLVLSLFLFLLFIGPWPVYRDCNYQDAPYFKEALRRIEMNAAMSEITEEPGRLRAAWAVRCITPAIGTPMAGYSERPHDKRSQGVRDDLYVKALVLSDGRDTVALVGADILMTTLNVAEEVWEEVGRHIPLDRNHILFTSSHTHNGPGGFAPGRLAEYSLGKYDPALFALIAEAISQAILEAYDHLAQSELAYGHVEASELIVNRVHDGPVDSLLRFMVIRKETEETCFVVRFSAHPTNFKEEDMDLSAEYPGEVCRFLQENTGAQAIFLGGAVGAMGPRPPEAEDVSTRIRLMGEALGRKVLDHQDALSFQTHVDIASVGLSMGMPSMQVRPLSSSWRLSPLLSHIVGLPRTAWIQAIRVGDLVFLGLPHDAGGELAKAWAEEAKSRNLEMWITSHCVAYCGYLSPDCYYWVDLEKDNYDMFYEFRLMNWFGPQQESMFADLKDHILFHLFPQDPHPIRLAPL